MLFVVVVVGVEMQGTLVERSAEEYAVRAGSRSQFSTNIQRFPDRGRGYEGLRGWQKRRNPYRMLRNSIPGCWLLVGISPDCRSSIYII